MDNPLQLVAWLALLALAVVSCQFILNQYRLYCAARETAALEFQFLRERIALIAEQPGSTTVAELGRQGAFWHLDIFA